MKPIKRIHHISATVADPNENLHFYRDILGLRLVKQTVNFEDDGTYHLYFANQQAADGSIMTFFPLTNNLKGRVGAGQTCRIAFAIPKDSIHEWKKQLISHQIDLEENHLFGSPSLLFQDVHGLSLALVESEAVTNSKDILGFYGVELLSEQPDETFKLLLNEMGMQLIQVSEDYYVLEMTGVEKHRVLINRKFTKRGRLGIGTVHHIAWSVTDKEELSKWKAHFDKDYRVTEIKDRKYFNSAYFRDPGHIIYELATVGPGFTVDESLDQLGSRLMLPEQYEEQRKEIEANLPKLKL